MEEELFIAERESPMMSEPAVPEEGPVPETIVSAPRQSVCQRIPERAFPPTMASARCRRQKRRGVPSAARPSVPRNPVQSGGAA